MFASFHLVAHNIICIASAVALAGLSLFVFLNGSRRRANIALGLTGVAALFFVVSHVIGVNITDPLLSRTILMFNLSMLFVGAFNLHSVLALLDQEWKDRYIIAISYGVAIGVTIFFSFYPNLFFLPSEPKMYFPNYYVPGVFNWIRVVYLYVLIVPYITYKMATAWKKTVEHDQRLQYKYFTYAIIVTYLVGLIPNFLVYNIQIDPLWGMAFGLMFAVPFLYGAVKYGLLNVKVIAQQAFFYSIIVIVVGAIVLILNYLHTFIVAAYPGYPSWVTALVSGILVATISTLVWKNLRTTDILKYEFITTVTHKFRTPLTTIKWATENLKAENLSNEGLAQIEYIKNSNSKLIELTDILANASETEKGDYDYQKTSHDISALAAEVIASLSLQITTKKLFVETNYTPGLTAPCDELRIKFVIQTFIENAIHYTPESGKISVTSFNDNGNAVFSVKDDGIGMMESELKMIFSKFYRSDKARSSDTEGMGIGLFISKKIIQHHEGKIWVASEGAGKGSQFSFSLPLKN